MTIEGWRVWRRRGLLLSLLLAALALAALVLAPPGTGPAQAAGDDEKKRPLTVEQLEDLAFGDMTGDPHAGGSVTIDPVSGVKTVLGSTFDMGGEHGRAEFLIAGEPGARFVIVLPGAHGIDGKGKGGKGSATVTDFTSHPSDIGALGPDGRAIVYVGATFKFGPGQPSGDYSGPLDIFVDYE